MKCKRRKTWRGSGDADEVLSNSLELWGEVRPWEVWPMMMKADEEMIIR